VDESIWAVQLVEHAGNCRGEMIVLEESRGGEEYQANPGRSAQAGRPPLLKEPPDSRFLQTSFPLLP
jgi:hypothetical protein